MSLPARISAAGIVGMVMSVSCLNGVAAADTIQSQPNTIELPDSPTAVTTVPVPAGCTVENDFDAASAYTRTTRHAPVQATSPVLAKDSIWDNAAQCGKGAVMSGTGLGGLTEVYRRSQTNVGRVPALQSARWQTFKTGAKTMAKRAHPVIFAGTVVAGCVVSANQ